MPTMDVLWHLGINAVAGRLLVRRTETVALYHFAAVFTLPSLALIAMQTWWRAAYVRRRIPLLLTLRFVREVSVAFLFLPFQNELWPAAAPPSAASCGQIVLAPQAAKVFYLFSRAVAYPLPLAYTVLLVAESTAIMLMQVPERCGMDMGVSSAAGACAVAWARGLEGVGAFWPFSAGQRPFGGRPLEPWEACTAVQATLMLVAGALLPLLLCATLEEKWRHDWLRWHGGGGGEGTPVVPSMITRLMFDAALICLGTTVCFHAVSLVIEGPLVPAAAQLLAALRP